jgi:hypothetical protein
MTQDKVVPLNHGILGVEILDETAVLALDLDAGGPVIRCETRYCLP